MPATRYMIREVCRTCYCLMQANAQLDEAAALLAAKMHVPSPSGYESARAEHVRSMRKNRDMIQEAIHVRKLQEAAQEPGPNPMMELITKSRASLATAASIALHGARRPAAARTSLNPFTAFRQGKKAMELLGQAKLHEIQAGCRPFVGKGCGDGVAVGWGGGGARTAAGGIAD